MNQRYVMFEPLYYLCQFLRIDIDGFIIGFEQAIRSFYSRLYNFFRQTQLFLSSIGQSLFSTRVDFIKLRKHLQMSIDFYNERERQSLHNLFQDSQAFESDWSDIFWNRKEERIRQFAMSDLGALCRDRLASECHKRVKHREINDLNDIFTRPSFYNNNA